MHSQSLHGRFRTAVMVIAALLAAVVAVFVYRTARSHYLATGEASARAIVAAVEQTVAVGIYARDDVLLKELVSGLARHPSVARVAVRDADGRQLATASSGFVSPDDATAAVGATEIPPSFESVLSSPFHQGEAVGRLHVWLDYARLSAEAQRQALIVVGGIVVLLTGMLIVFNALASRLLSRPMHALAEQLRQIQPGSSLRLKTDRQHEHDEIGVVTKAANHLLELQQHALERERSMREEIAAMEARYRGIFASSSAGIFVLSPQGHLLQANPALERLLGLAGNGSAAGLRGKFVNAVFRDPAQLNAIVEAARASSQPEDGDLELASTSSGAAHWVHCMVSVVVDDAGGERWIEGVLYDITQRKMHELAAQHRAEHDALTGLKSRSFIESTLDHRLHLAHTHDAAVTLMFIDLDGFKGVNDRWGHAAGDAVLIEAARRLRALFMRSSDIVGRLGGDELVVVMEGLDALNPAVHQMAIQLIDAFRAPFLLPNGEAAQVGASVGVASYPRHATNAETLIHAADAAMYAVKKSGKGGFVVAHTSESAEADAAGSKPARDAETAQLSLTQDPLTGLPDRRQLCQRLAAARDLVAAGAGLAVVICLDLDQFKSVNVAYGSPVGDQVLREVARRLSSSLRRDDMVARTGSDEFVLVVMTKHFDRQNVVQDSTAITRKLLAAVAQPITVSGGTLTLHAGAGLSLIDGNAADPDAVLRESQLALRRSKASSRRSVVFFERDMMVGFQERLELEQELQAAIGSAQFLLHVQPQVELDGEIRGGEALLRWRHPERGFIPPDEFIPLAESSGVIVELGAWVLRAGCDIVARMHRAGLRKTLSINISPAQFSHPGFVSLVRDALASSGVPPQGLILEITENLLISDLDWVASRLEELVALGVRFSIDDFGTGFSSLSYLQRLPLHEIKIDRSFTAGLPREAASAGIVRSILSMGSHLGLQVVAEGVETVEQSQFLQAHSCTAQQGWLHGKPMDIESFLLHIAVPSEHPVVTELAS